MLHSFLIYYVRIILRWEKQGGKLVYVELGKRGVTDQSERRIFTEGREHYTRVDFEISANYKLTH